MDKKLNIGIFNESYFPQIDGVAMVVDNYCRHLSKYANVTLFTSNGKTKFDDSVFPYKVVRCRGLNIKGTDYKLPLPKLSNTMMKEVKNGKFDLVHIHTPFSIGSVGMEYAKKHKIPCVATLHTQFKRDFMRETKNNKLIVNYLVKRILKVLNEATECWAVNEETKNVYLEYGLTQTPKVYNNATDMVPFENEKELNELKAKYNIKKDEATLLFVGRITALKNVFFIADSLKLLKEKGFKFKMIFVGNGPDYDKLVEQINADGLNDYVIFAGKITDRQLLIKHFAIGDLFLFPSLYDASSLVQIEAASQSTPALFLDGAVTAGTVTKDVNGFFSEYKTESYANKIIEIFKDKKYYNKVKEGAYKDLYVNWEQKIDGVYQDYLRLIQENKEFIEFKKRLKESKKKKKDNDEF